jgi:hypothetical protein
MGNEDFDCVVYLPADDNSARFDYENSVPLECES